MSINIKTSTGLKKINSVYIKPIPPTPPADGKTRLYISLAEGRLSPVLGLGVNGSVDVDWGDGTEHGTLTGSGTATLVTIQHTYSQGGDYIIVLTPAEGTTIAVLGTNGVTLLLAKNGTVNNEAQAYRTSLKKALLGDGITSIGNYAFMNCYSLASITIPDSVTSIGDQVFDNCYSLASISLPDSITSIRNFAFYNLSGITSITIPDGITSIGTYVFSNCKGLGFIKFEPITPPSAGSGAFGGIPTDCVIYVPQGTLEAYKSASNYPNPSTYTYVEY